ncbi:MAG: sugar phosphorylase [Candidatus Mcinerneyibacterium aminivorans]|uniref:Sugar phosphorylase n=1 Tax=Candidatus Mcinerneyibacterium aminivorans TaxID=2703815 RepID=A0A5D0MK03_9BACT|nr:MAG: sugar phosphorylase [Candidatus Mcinerneyibacterium aminivorans]
MDKDLKKIKYYLSKIYDTPRSENAFYYIKKKLENRKHRISDNILDYFNEKDVLLITYGDSIKKENEKSLKYLRKFYQRFLSDSINKIHILPFFPYSSDDGFSIIDYYKINPDMGEWADIGKLSKDVDLMFDYVCNHISSQSGWFENYLEEKPGFRNLAIEVDPDTDLSGVVRPRDKPLLTEFEKKSGEKVHVWTTFSSDQIDLNFKDIEVFKKMIDVFLFYIGNNAKWIRLDAIAYLWKEIGTSCIHLPEVHYFVKLLRTIMNSIIKDGVIITETNVPHKDNISYFGNGRDEAQIVYNFTLPPLLLYSFIKEDITEFSRWVKKLKTPSNSTTFLNFTASHDGIGVRPLEGIIDNSEIEDIIKHIKNNGGMVSYKTDNTGGKSPYELNITYLDALKFPEDKNELINIKRFLASQIIAMVLPGIPAVYIHSLIGTRNWLEGIEKTNRKRTINRKKFEYEEIMNQIKNDKKRKKYILDSYTELLKKRKQQEAFHPNANFEPININKRVFCIKRWTNYQTLYCLTNISKKRIEINSDKLIQNPKFRDLISNKNLSNKIKLDAYQSVWLEPERNK